VGEAAAAQDAGLRCVLGLQLLFMRWLVYHPGCLWESSALLVFSSGRSGSDARRRRQLHAGIVRGCCCGVGKTQCM
jgi:hypothetical protein